MTTLQYEHMVRTRPYHFLSMTQFLVVVVGALLPGVLFLALDESLTQGPNWLLLAVEGVLLAPMVVARVVLRRPLPYRVVRLLALILLAVVAVALVISLALLVANLHQLSKAGSLLRSAGLLWGTNVLVFALSYWEIDGGGPHHRHRSGYAAVDFLFPQQSRPDGPKWAPGFVDYVFLAFCFATALSPADAAPLSQRAKLLMMAEALISLLILVLLVARSVNIF
ncbi:MAG: hypothetical protein PVSMB4_18230 [Ktedonobacterales bacterium]